MRQVNAAIPRGFSDTLFKEAARREQLSACLGEHFAAAGYELVETPNVEYLETLQRAMMTPESRGSELFRFVDVDGRLLALRNDVTIALARVVASRFTLLPPPWRLRYRADVFREQESLRGNERQVTQLGIECFGLPRETGDLEILQLALGSLRATGLRSTVLHLSDVGVIRALLDDVADQTPWYEAFSAAWHSGDHIGARELAEDGTLAPERATAIVWLLTARGGAEVLSRARELLGDCEAAQRALSNVRRNFEATVAAGFEGEVLVDFSLLPVFNYYSGLVFELYARLTDGTGLVLGSGGRYDTLMEQFGRCLPAAGFVYDLSRLERAVADAECSAAPARRPLRIAVPKGKLFDDCIALLSRAGVTVAGMEAPGRSLRLANDDYELIIAKPSDVAIYVSRGAADVGVGGRDILVEADFPLLQLADLRFGGCEFVVAVPQDCTMTLDELSLQLGTVRVATKYPRLTQRFFDGRGIQVEIVKLNGNIELGPLIGIADVIVDITQTGATLRENKLRVLERVLPSTARFVANAVAARTDPRVAALTARLQELVCS
ncbi:MAG: ATP phosphoribosyltransferase [Actinomycetia bacterium]|nr:ATP phosphoribosyltransferase [Actinomycetes bacterium]